MPCRIQRDCIFIHTHTHTHTHIELSSSLPRPAMRLISPEPSMPHGTAIGMDNSEGESMGACFVMRSLGLRGRRCT